MSAIEVETLLNEIDELNLFDGSVLDSLKVKLSDCTGAIGNIEAELVALRRLLIQNGDPKVVVTDSGTTLEEAITHTVRQLKRLRTYKSELDHSFADAEAEEFSKQNRIPEETKGGE